MEPHEFSGYGMDEFQGGGVQGNSGDPGEIWVIEIIPHKGGAQVLHMHPDLMGAPCLQTQFSQCDLTACLQYSVVGDRPFSVFKVYAPLNGRTSLLAMGASMVPWEEGRVPSQRAR